jgi:hypothetical protein
LTIAAGMLASDRALSIATIETPFFGLDYPGYVDPQVAYWHLGMHMHVDITQFLVEGREEHYLRHFFRDFAYNPNRDAGKRSATVCHAHAAARQPPRQPQPLRGHSADGGAGRRTDEDALSVPKLAWGGQASFGEHCFASAKAIAVSAEGGVIGQ